MLIFAYQQKREKKCLNTHYRFNYSFGWVFGLHSGHSALAIQAMLPVLCIQQFLLDVFTVTDSAGLADTRFMHGLLCWVEYFFWAAWNIKDILAMSVCVQCVYVCVCSCEYAFLSKSVLNKWLGGVILYTCKNLKFE